MRPVASPHTPSNLYQKGGPTLPNQIEIPAGLVSFANALDEWERAVEEAHSGEPKKFLFNNIVYEHVPGTEPFKLPDTPLDENGNPIETLTALQIMKQHFKPTRSYYRRITPTGSAEVMYLLGDSARYKIIRAVQLHYSEPPVTAETKTFTPFFQFLSTGIEDHWTVQQQYSSCKWAAPKDEELATSLLLHYVWAQKFPDFKLKDCCIYQMRRADDGIHLIFSEPHTFNDRLQAGCARAHGISEIFEGRQEHAPYDLLFKEACRVFFSYNKYYVSMTSDYRQAIMNKIQAFCLRLTNAVGDRQNPEYPHIDQPENLLEVKYDEKYGEPEEYILKWEDFIFDDKATSAMMEQRRSNGTSIHNAAIAKAWANLDPDKEYTGAELRQICSSHTITKAIKENNLLKTRKVGRTQYYKLNYERS